MATQPVEAVVVDASVAAKWYLNDEEAADKALLLVRRFMQGHTEIRAPDQIRYEVPAAIARASMGSSPRVELEIGRQGIEAFLSRGISTINSDDLIISAYSLLHQYGCSFYYPLYLALSQRISVALLTADQRFYRTVQRYPSIVWIGDYNLSCWPDRNIGPLTHT